MEIVLLLGGLWLAFVILGFVIMILGMLVFGVLGILFLLLGYVLFVVSKVLLFAVQLAQIVVLTVGNIITVFSPRNFIECRRRIEEEIERDYKAETGLLQQRE